MRSDPKAGDPSDWPNGLGPQSDEIRINNYVCCVRGGTAELRTEAPAQDPAVEDEEPAPPPSAQSAFITRLDANGDGKVSRKEFDGPAGHFGDFDRDGDGFIESDEAPTGPPSPRKNRQEKR